MIDFLGIRLVIFDFDGVFTDNKVYTDQFGNESVCCWRSDGIGISKLKEIGINVLIVSTEINPVVSARAKKLNILCKQGVNDKAEVIRQLSNELNISLKEIVFVGNDINDISALKLVEIPIAVNDSYPEIFPFVKLITKRSGGQGAVREVCDLIYLSNKKQSEK